MSWKNPQWVRYKYQGGRVSKTFVYFQPDTRTLSKYKVGCFIPPEQRCPTCGVRKWPPMLYACISGPFWPFGPRFGQRCSRGCTFAILLHGRVSCIHEYMVGNNHESWLKENGYAKVEQTWKKLEWKWIFRGDGKRYDFHMYVQNCS